MTDEIDDLKTAITLALRHGLIREAQASTALDKDPNYHTCHDECIEYPQCPGNTEVSND
jgi:hypothetical protein